MSLTKVEDTTGDIGWCNELSQFEVLKIGNRTHGAFDPYDAIGTHYPLIGVCSATSAWLRAVQVVGNAAFANLLALRNGVVEYRSVRSGDLELLSVSCAVRIGCKGSFIICGVFLMVAYRSLKCSDAAAKSKSVVGSCRHGFD